MAHTPKHIEVYNAIKEAILSGRLGYGERLYNESWLCEALHVSRATLRKAVLKLVDDGYLEHRVNMGFYVSHLVPSAGTHPMLTIVERLKATGGVPSSKIHYFALGEAGARYARILGIEPSDEIIEIHRRLYVDNEIFAVNHLILVGSAFPDFNPWRLTTGMLHDVLGEYGQDVVESVQRADAVLASKEIARLLGVSYRKPLLHMETVESTANGGWVEYQETWADASGIPYSLRIDWGGQGR